MTLATVTATPPLTRVSMMVTASISSLPSATGTRALLEAGVVEVEVEVAEDDVIVRAARVRGQEVLRRKARAGRSRARSGIDVASSRQGSRIEGW